ncbi:EutP/PduV family microcompartment system protein [Proteinivorax tanatarense]|uniref:EutP/PduV family microcompartment system protein n=1 Tax=Proteinivorax tanatarense TaxID=1260629 RepID=A0AAU7VJJ6_9FIRM
MKKLMLIGKTGSGKTSLSQRLNNRPLGYKKTQAIEYEQYILDTPGEYIENSRFYNALTTVAVDCDVIGLLQAANETYDAFPPGFGASFNKPIIGIITKIDLVENWSNAREELIQAGAKKIFPFSAITNEGLENIKDYLQVT